MASRTTPSSNDRSGGDPVPGSVWRAPGIPALVGMVVAGFAGYSLLMPVAPLWAVRGGADEAGAGFVTGVFMLFTVLVQLCVPAVLRRFGWTPVLITGLALLGLPSPLHLVSGELWWILLISAVRGAGFAVLTVCGASAVAELVEPARRGRAIGVFGLGIAAPQVLLLPAAPWLAEHLGFWFVFALGAVPVLGIAAAVPLGRRLDGLPPHPDPAQEAHHGVRRYLGLIPPMFVLLGVTLAGGALITFVPQLSVPAVVVTVGLLLLTGLAALTRWGIGHLADRWGAQRLLWPFVIVTAGGMALTASAVLDQPDTWRLLGGMALVGIGYGALQNLTLAASFSAVARRDQVVASAVWNIGFDTGTGVGAVVVGMIASALSLSPALLIAAGLSLLTLPLAFIRTDRPGAH
ncbi:MFS transporter [Microbacterium pseudoresistens]|uniref:Putative MFS family arabinose efflux permease n=1 Tax=Microbacterium pseudoresistens TaxID=640634 RepID=A0A7Y9JNM8_9MICO|nr:MFS transporter [Microbacterium pseudoresistens]NYD54698.1 putative MFS family arabinose efflux permease [Microbacterium pseudoresistens]